MINRSVLICGLVAVFSAFAIQAQAIDFSLSPDIYLRAGALYQSTEFDYHSAYIKYLRAHGTDQGFEEQFISDRTDNDIFLDEASIGLSAKAGEHVAGHASLIWERIYSEKGMPDLDTAYIKFIMKSLSFEIGRDYLYMAQFASKSVFDPWTQRLAETRADVLTIDFDALLLKLWGSALKGQYPVNPKPDESSIEDYAAGIELRPLAMRNDMSLKLGASYLSDICETKFGFGKLVTKSTPETILALVDTNGDGVQDTWVEITVGERENVYERRVDLWTIYEYFQFSLAPDIDLGLDFEYSFAGRSFKRTDLTDSIGHEARPAAYNAELWVRLYGVLNVAARMQGAKDFQPFSTQADEAREIGPIVAFTLGSNLTVSLEYMYGEDSDKDTWNKAMVGVELRAP